MRRIICGCVAVLMAGVVSGCATKPSESSQTLTFLPELVVASDVDKNAKGSGYCYLSWEYAERSTAEFPISLEFARDGRTDVIRLGERNVAKIDPGMQTVSIAAMVSKNQTSPPLNLELALEPTTVTRVVVITNRKEKEKAIEVVVYDEREQVVQRRFGQLK